MERAAGISRDCKNAHTRQGSQRGRLVTIGPRADQRQPTGERHEIAPRRIEQELPWQMLRPFEVRDDPKPETPIVVFDLRAVFPELPPELSREHGAEERGSERYERIGGEPCRRVVVECLLHFLPRERYSERLTLAVDLDKRLAAFSHHHDAEFVDSIGAGVAYDHRGLMRATRPARTGRDPARGHVLGFERARLIPSSCRGHADGRAPAPPPALGCHFNAPRRNCSESGVVKYVMWSQPTSRIVAIG